MLDPLFIYYSVVSDMSTLYIFNIPWPVSKQDLVLIKSAHMAVCAYAGIHNVWVKMKNHTKLNAFANRADPDQAALKSCLIKFYSVC